ncbi:MAG: Mrp/NBP35 family ATP-binding protein [Candidatus Parvarchaeota archaeon]|nr:Mrp/NBP35 family ATP-binding protein [Candidatus Parvarchaeota archaeon]
MNIPKEESERILSILSGVNDPEIGISIVKLRMIDSVEREDGRLIVNLKLTVPGCPLSETLEKDITDRLNSAGYQDVEVKFGYMSKEELNEVKEQLKREKRMTPPPIEKYEKRGIGNIIAVYSAKGGVGKSTVVSMLALAAEQLGYKAGILDCDVSGPSIRSIFKIKGLAEVGEDKRFIPKEANGIKMIGADMLTDAQVLIWRGPLVSSAIKQMYSDTDWGDLDVLFLDLPPGTSDAPLTVFQSLPVDKIVIVTTPNSLAQITGKKTELMADALKIPVAGVIENMDYIEHGGERIYLENRNKDISFNGEILAKLPYDLDIEGKIAGGKLDKGVSDALVEVIKRLM